MSKKEWGSIPAYVPALIPAKLKLRNGSEFSTRELLLKAAQAQRTMFSIVPDFQKKLKTRRFGAAGYDRAVIIANSTPEQVAKMFPNFSQAEIEAIQAHAQEKLKHRNNPYELKVSRVSSWEIAE